MILTKRIAYAVASGEVTVAYRRWIEPRVTPGSTFRTVAGVVRVDGIEPVSMSVLTDADARRAGYPTLDELESTFRGDETASLYRVDISWAGPDAREALAADSDLSDEDIAGIDALLDRLDARTPWARSTLESIDQQPGITAAELVADLPMNKESLKRRIRTLKEHGLTRSLRVGYSLSARGRAYLAATDRTGSAG